MHRLVTKGGASTVSKYPEHWVQKFSKRKRLKCGSAQSWAVSAVGKQRKRSRAAGVVEKKTCTHWYNSKGQPNIVNKLLLQQFFHQFEQHLISKLAADLVIYISLLIPIPNSKLKYLHRNTTWRSRKVTIQKCLKAKTNRVWILLRWI